MSFGPPTTAEIDALERVLAEADGHMPDGYWRTLAEDGLEAARRAAMADELRRLDAEIAWTNGLLDMLRAASMNRIDPVKHYKGVLADAKIDGLFHQLGKGRN